MYKRLQFNNHKTKFFQNYNFCKKSEKPFQHKSRLIIFKKNLSFWKTPSP